MSIYLAIAFGLFFLTLIAYVVFLFSRYAKLSAQVAATQTWMMQEKLSQLEESTLPIQNDEPLIGEIIMAQTIEDLSANYTDESGQQLSKELNKEVLTRGAWATVMFLYQEWDKKTNDWGAPKARIERFQKRNGEFRSQSRFKFTSAKQAHQIIEVLSKWFPSAEDDGEADE